MTASKQNNKITNNENCKVTNMDWFFDLPQHKRERLTN